MPLRLRDHLHYCDCGGRVVFLDLLADRYFCLPSAANHAFLGFVDGQDPEINQGPLGSLIKQGLLVKHPEHAALQKRPSIDPPTHDYQAEPFARAKLRHVARLLGAELRWSLMLRTRPIRQVIDAAARQGPRSRREAADRAEVLHATAAAAAASALVSRAHDRCLLRALSVHSLCRTGGIDTKLVFGVIAHPFSAHCWVQHGSGVVVGSFEHARLFTPILVVQ